MDSKGQAEHGGNTASANILSLHRKQRNTTVVTKRQRKSHDFTVTASQFGEANNHWFGRRANITSDGGFDGFNDSDNACCFGCQVKAIITEVEG